jgi:hypothetical protein
MSTHKKYIPVLCILIIGILLINGCSRKPANYYRKVDIGSRYEIIGKYPVADKIVNKINCYHFIYNEKGKITKVEYLIGGKPRNDSHFGVAQIIIEYSEGYEKKDISKC